MRILLASNQRAKAEDAFREYEAIGHLVESGRVQEVAEKLDLELFSAESDLRCPVDADPPRCDLELNTAAMRAHVLQKVFDMHLSVEETAKKLGVDRRLVPKLRKELDSYKSVERG